MSIRTVCVRARVHVHCSNSICVPWQVLQKDALLRTERQLFTYLLTVPDRLRHTVAEMESRLCATQHS